MDEPPVEIHKRLQEIGHETGYEEREEDTAKITHEHYEDTCHSQSDDKAHDPIGGPIF